jgi:hypothetical protein
VLADEEQFWPRVSLGLWGEVEPRAAERLRKQSAINAKHANLFGALNNAGHDLIGWDPKDVLRDTKRALTDLMDWRNDAERR